MQYFKSFNMTFKTSIFAICLLANTFLFCQAKNVNLIFNHTVNGLPLKFNESVFPIWNNKVMNLKRAEFYLSKFKLTAKDGQTKDFPEQYMLVDASKPNDKYFLGSIENMDLNELAFSIGIDKDKNHLDPTTYPETNPLGLKDPSMHWGWAGGYRFLVVEGQVDLDANNKPESDFEYHSLGDDLYKEAKVNISMDESTDEININLLVDYTKLFNKLTMVGNNIQHGSAAKNITMISNAVGGEFITQLATTSTKNELNKVDFKIKDNGNSLLLSIDNTIQNPSIKVYDITGRVVFTQPINNSETQIQKNSLPNAILYFTLYNGKEMLKTLKFVNK